jgi:hypothetical protein
MKVSKWPTSFSLKFVLSRDQGINGAKAGNEFMQKSGKDMSCLK